MSDTSIYTLIKSYLGKPSKYRYYLLMKNTTPRQLAIIIALLLGGISLLSLLLFKFILSLSVSYLSIFGFAFFNMFIGYVLFYFALERFIYRRIKLIYKRIHRLKTPADSASPSIDMDRNMIEEVEAMVFDWTEQKKEEIAQLKQLEIYRREFLGNVSHELKTPIFNLQGYLHTLLDGGMDDENINTKYLNKAAQNAERLSTIVKDLEVITRHEAGELKLRWQSFNIYQLAQDVMDSLEMAAEANDIQLIFKDGCDPSTLVWADKDKIEQVLFNLMTNSIKYGKPAGTTWVGIYDMDKYILIEVTDNGVGIEEKHLPRVFERFYRVDWSRSRMDGGSGLGLAIVKHLVEAHRQSIHVRSKINIGSTFGFTLAKAP